ncbi:MAG: DUF2970 domain-containing protein [Gammaproteobacteria bacterium]|uniref:DUF2970 domain-containing protein n=1 Tax=Pseudomaricurvus alcaniphilus TaxID=1166482 RepID=UPI00140AE832|nr:DUF2970 domain-containing protein [Pseudomaricurvus alcaniphilus]MBR9912364.1 DUF2970 domain-containing protein [Gammaproteobacteria bacterium]NHN35815.1 DUF2970 domain-containing protein [Pseudomaricurvus alcaniphilus]
MEQNNKPGLRDILVSTVAAAFGVQSKANQERDFKHGNIWVFIVAGIIFTAAFVATVYLIVRSVLATA